MASGQQHPLLLDQIQTQVNQVLEQTGRVFAAISANPTALPTAQSARLKSMLPAASDRLHEALDKLDTELQFTMLVMRRDLAVCRERSGVRAQSPSQNHAPQGDTAHPQSNPTADATDAQSTAISDFKPQPKIEDVNMTDVPSSRDAKPVISDESVTVSDSTKKPTPPNADAPPQTSSSKEAKLGSTTENSESLQSALQIDTKPTFDEKKSDEEKAPDTSNDLDSLFNDPISASGPTEEFTFDQPGSHDMDFDPFGDSFDTHNAGTDDNLSSLLPGLEDYANAPPGSNGADADVDLEQIFNFGGGGGGGGENAPTTGSGAGEKPPQTTRDTTFDDLLDMADFDAGIDGDNGNENTTGTNAGSYDFDDLFQ